MKKFFSNLWLLVTNRFEAVFQRLGERSLIFGTTQDARLDITQSDRLELVRRSRNWEQNSGIANRLGDLFEQFTTGANGLQMVPNSKDEEWNAAASEWWNVWCQYPDLTSRQPFSILQSLIARRWFFDGEVFIYKTFSPDSGRPRIQLFEGHRVETPGDLKEEEGRTIIDGVRIDAKGRPIGYYFIEDDKSSKYPATSNIPQFAKKYVYRKAEQVVHIFEPERPGQYRGIPFLYPVMNDLHDLDDLQLLEMKAAKAAAEVTNIITNATGELSTLKMRRQRFQMNSQDQAGNSTSKPADEFSTVTFGGRTIALKTGEDMKQFMSNRPSVATREYWDYLTSKVCAGVGISKLLVMPYSNQGTVVRADLDVASIFFRSRSQVIATGCRDIYSWVMGWAKDFARELDGANPPPDWYSVVVRPPRSPNVDVGRNSAAMLAELEAGTRTFQDIYAETGEDWREQLRQKAEERLYIRQLAKEFSKDGIELTPDEIAGMSKPADPPEPESTPEPKSEPAEP